MFSSLAPFAVVRAYPDYFALSPILTERVGQAKSYQNGFLIKKMILGLKRNKEIRIKKILQCYNGINGLGY